MKKQLIEMNKNTVLQFAMIGMLTFMTACGGDEPQSENLPDPIETETASTDTATAARTGGLDARMAAGKVAYEKICQACHQADGKGLPSAFPTLAQSDYLDADLTRAISGVVNGLEGEITVNGEKFNQVMPKADLTDQEIADVFTYVLNSFGNKGGEVSPAEVAATRK